MTTVLVRGETGTGKEVVARRVHALSSRAHRPFLKVNCGALPEGIVESALFGHERGAFTGATKRNIGYFERAHGGTLLLDEVADLPLASQVKLLRVLQEGELERVGGEQTIRVDVRVVAATHRNLERMVEEEKLREDLYYRLNVYPIVVPPLRDRPEDIEALSAAIVQRMAKKLGRPVVRMSRATLAQLTAYSWPGNVRELENVLERAMLVSRGDSLQVDLPTDESRVIGDSRVRTTKEGEVLTFQESSKRAIVHALDACNGRIYGDAGAASALGLRPTTLQSKMVRLGIVRSQPPLKEAAKKRGR
jgi:transcriptional regulator with GAF, ATPase, and Fis domain